MAYSSVRTLYMGRLELCRAMNKPYTPLPFSTWNEKLQIQHGASVPDGAIPEIGLLMIGRGGHRNVVGADGEPLTDILQHKITNAVLMKPLPVASRPIDDDFSANERSRYRLRRVETHHGEQRFMYYAIKINFESTDPETSILTIDPDTGEVTPTEYVPDPSQLNATPVSMVNGEANTATNKHISTSIPVTVVLSKSDCARIVDAAVFVYNDVRYAHITEIAIGFGVDQTVTTADGGINISYKESLITGTANFIGASINLRTTSKEVKLDYRLASTMPFLE